MLMLTNLNSMLHQKDAQKQIENENTNANSVGHFGYRAQGISNKSGYHALQKLKIKNKAKYSENMGRSQVSREQAFARRFGPWCQMMTLVESRILYKLQDPIT